MSPVISAPERDFLATHTQSFLKKDGARDDLVSTVKRFLPTAS